MLYQENAVLNALKKDGIEAEQVTVVKNGITCKGIRICSNDGISPVIYYSEEETMSEFLSRVHSILQYDAPQIDLDEITSWQRVRERIYLSVQKHSDDEVIKKQYLNLDVILRLALDLGIDGEGTIKVTEGLAEKIGVSEEELWLMAKRNTRDSTVIRRLSEILGIDDDDEEEDGGLYVASAGHYGGASVLLLPEIFAQLCKEHSEKDCYILPSSVEEVIVIFGSEVRNRMSVKELARMVDIINNEQVDPLLQLPPVVYQYRTCDNTICIATTA